MDAENDAVVAELALARGWLEPGALRRALAIQGEAAAAGLARPLLQVLRTKGFVGEAEGAELARLVELAELAERGDAIEGYRIEESLGQWGLGAGFRAVQLSMGRAVALKVLAPELAAQARVLERFRREVRATGRTSHPNLVGGLDSGCCGEFHYYATERVEGHAVAKGLADGPLPPAYAVEVAEGVAAALRHAEAVGLVHLDITPGRIVVTAEGLVKLCDLGLTRRPGDPSVTRTGIPAGTPDYISPELASGSREPDVRSDIYAFGACLYHLVVGRTPFGPGPIDELLRRHIEESPRPAAEARPDVPEPLSRLVARMMAKDPADRYQGPEELLGAIRGVRPAVRGRRRGAGAATARALPAIAPPALEEPSLPSIAPAEPPPSPEEPVELEAVEEPPAPGARRRGAAAAVLWAGLVAALAGGLAGSAQWAVRVARRPSAAEQRQDAQGHKDAERAAPPREAHPEAGRMAAEALRFSEQHPDAHAEALLRLRRAALAGGVPAVDEELVARRMAFAREGSRAFGELSATVRSLRDDDRFGEALRAVAAFPQGLRAGRWRAGVADRFEKLSAQAEQRYLELAAGGAAALRQGRFDEALELYQAVGELGIPWIEEAGQALHAAASDFAEAERQRLAEVEQRRAVLQRRAAFGALEKAFRQVRARVAERDFRAALEVCEGIPPGRREGEPGHAVAHVERRLRLLASLWDAVLAGPPAAEGLRMSVHGQEGVVQGFDGPPDARRVRLAVPVAGGGETVVGLRIRGLGSDQLVALAERALADEPEPRRELAIGLFLMAEGERKQARRKLEAAKAAGGDVEPELRELEARQLVEQALQAYQEKATERARELLRTLLDDYATTLAVIAQHSRLMNALAATGEPMRPPPLRRAPLPAAVRRLTLLPATRLRPRPPDELLAAQFGEPLERGGPQLLGLSAWTDYTLSLSWTQGQAGPFVLFFRFAGDRPGGFRYGYVALSGERVVLGRCAEGQRAEVAAAEAAGLDGAGRHRLEVALRGEQVRADLDGSRLLEARVEGLSGGNVGLAVGEGELVVHDFSLTLPSAAEREADSEP
ncbi:MAG: protein kinase domain-containing protein [Candidatus Brocadiia bacterium]